MTIAETFHNHPGYVVGGGVLVVGTLFLLMSRGPSSSGAAVASGPTDAQVAAGSNYQIAQLETGAALQGKAIDAQTSLRESQDALSALSLNDTFQQNIATLGAATSIRNTDTAAAVENNKTIAGENVGLAGISSQEALGMADYATQQRQIQSSVDIAGIEADVAKQTAGYQAATAISASHDNALTTSELIAANAQTAQLVSNNQTNVAKKQSDNGFLGSILGTVSSILPFFL